jgi:L-lactate dehydrogenase complex protein LldG
VTTAAGDEVLRSIRATLATAARPDTAPAHPGPFQGYPGAPLPGDEALVARFGHQLEALSGRMHRASSPADAARVVLEVVARNQAQQVLSWDEEWLGCPGLHAVLEHAGVRILRLNLPDDGPGRKAQLAEAEQAIVGISGAQAAIAETGTIVVASGTGRSRLVSLLPPVHVALVPGRRIYPTLPSFLAANPGVVLEASNVVLVTGPSRTADIEMTLTHGVHGPREVHAIVVP